MTPSSYDALAQHIAAQFANLPQVEAVALAGSRAGAFLDAASDIDVYVYTCAEIPLAEREQIVEACGGASQTSLGLTFWGPSDEWFHAPTGIEIDVVYFDTVWMEQQLDRVISQHQPSLGYTTSFWYTVRRSRILHDPRGWFNSLQARADQPYPEALRRNIITFNHPILRGVIPAYLHQLEKAVRRSDGVSINRCLTGLFASYFDILFALNRLLHPGEKRLVAFALRECQMLPVNMAADVDAMLRAAPHADHQVLEHVTALLDRLDELLEREGFIRHDA